jgi:hypothetical protein
MGDLITGLTVLVFVGWCIAIWGHYPTDKHGDPTR